MQLHWHIFWGLTAIPIKREIQTFLGSTETWDCRDRIMFMSAFNDIEHRKPDNEQTCTRGYRICKAIPVVSLVFLWTWTRKSVVPYELGQTSRRLGSHRQGIWHRSLNKLHIHYFCGAEPLLKGDLKSEKGQGTIHFQITIQNKEKDYPHIGAQCESGFDQNKANKLTTVKYQNFLKLISRIWPPQRPNCFRRPIARQRTQQNHCSSATRCRFLNRSWQMPIFCDQTLTQRRRKMDTCLQRAHTTSRQSWLKINVLCVIMCVSAQSWIRRHWIWQDYTLQKSWCHWKRFSTNTRG